jgi:replicative DNA helicase
LADTDKDLVYTPGQVSELTLKEIERRASDKSPGILFGLPNVDSKLVPLRPGELTVLLGRPSMYKSGLAQWWVRRIAEEQLSKNDDKIALYVTTEMAIEELGLYDLAVGARLNASVVARGELTEQMVEQLERAAVRRASLPLWLLGHSLALRRKRLSINMFTIERALFWIEDKMTFTAKIIFIDYLNLLDSSREAGHTPSGDRRYDMMEVVKCAKDMALHLGCPVVLLAQAKREVDEREWKVPTMSDGMETSAIEQYSDKIMSVWYPNVSDPGGNITSPSGRAYKITPNLLFLALLKQKNGLSGGVWPLYVDPAHNLIGMYEDQTTEPDWMNR